MLITTGKVSGAAIEFEPGSLPEGARVTILAPEDNEVFQLGSEDEARLLEALAEAERGEVISASTVLEEIRKS
jgi:hypothetical protein